MPEPTYAQGDVVLVPFPFTDLTSSKVRPAFVLSNEAFNRGRDIVVCAMTSNVADSEHSVLVGPQDMASGSLLAPSRAKVAKIVTLQKDIVRKRLGRTNERARKQVLRELEALFS